MPLKFLTTLCFGTLLATVGCSSTAQSPSSSNKMVVATTMSTLASLVQTVAGDRATVANLVPVGVSPEDYQPTPRDIGTLSAAKVLIENGSGLESWLSHTIESAKNPSLQIVVCTDGMPVVGGNPHLWMNPQYAKTYIKKIAAALERADPAGKATYEANATTERAQLDRLDGWIAARMKTIPPAHRNMVVFHNAWLYYNARYGITTVGAIELSPGQEPSPQYIAKLIALAKANHVRAVFAEPEYSQKLAKSLASDAGINVVSNLYDDSLSASGPVHDYDSMLRFDTDTIVAALK
ncbi:MAG: metal ABC transporter substrate-binding protein [Candidatus Eremiobacteraeota bacterium]|nr:metal ABC transporter substrate-binding protein [Candidatus Eremiobacteraeota bacterium]